MSADAIHTWTEPGHYFGCCPECGHDRYRPRVLNVGSDHWYVCKRHKVKWLVGSNLFSGWREESPGDWASNEVELSGYALLSLDETLCPACPIVWQAAADGLLGDES